MTRSGASSGSRRRGPAGSTSSTTASPTSVPGSTPTCRRASGAWKRRPRAGSRAATPATSGSRSPRGCTAAPTRSSPTAMLGCSPAAGEAFKLEQLSTRGSGRLEVGMHAARGWSLSSSVITTVLIATLHPGLLVILPITAALGSVFAIKAVRSFKTARLESARNEGLRAVANYLNQARIDAGRASTDILRHSHANLRDYYFERAEELLSTAQQGRSAAVQAVQAAESDDTGARQRAAETEADLARVHQLLDAADAVLAQKGAR